MFSDELNYNASDLHFHNCYMLETVVDSLHALR